MQKEPLLFLCHRIPFPPNKGDKIRSFNILKELSEHYDIHLASFVDDPYDWQYADKLDAYCKSKLLVSQNKLVCKIKGLSAFLTGKPISLPYYSSSEISRWVEKTTRSHDITKVFVYSSAVAQFVPASPAGELDVVVDFVDVDSDKWRQYADGKSGLAKWVYRREWKKLAAYENKVTAECKHALFVSPQEAELFTRQLPAELHSKVHGLLNGVDTAFFDPDAKMEPLSGDKPDVVFTGAMDYWANVDAVIWFCKHVWPDIIARFPDATFTIVGGNPTQQVKSLQRHPGVVVTGRVKDVRPYVDQSKVVVAPLQIARGIQNKVLEAMSLAKPVIATSMAMEGIEARGPNLLIEDDAARFAQGVCRYLEQPSAAPENRQWICENLEWHATLSALPHYFAKDKL